MLKETGVGANAQPDGSSVQYINPATNLSESSIPSSPSTPSLDRFQRAPVRIVTQNDQTCFGHALSHRIIDNLPVGDGPPSNPGSEKGIRTSVPTSQSLPSSPYRSFGDPYFRSPNTPSAHRRRFRDVTAASAFYTPRRASLKSLPISPKSSELLQVKVDNDSYSF